MIALCEATVIAGKYRLERTLANGGMGAVWVARHLQLDDLVAIKFMSAALPELADARRRFAREARAAARLRSPHVVQVLDHGVDGDVPYIVMELLSGENLGERLKREGRLPLREALSVVEQVAKALAFAHRAGIVHRDLKPANIFLARIDDEEIVKVLDFGIAKALGQKGVEATHSDVLIGSPLYMSPEQARGERSVDHHADLWSLGTIIFRALTGVPAFHGTSAVDVIVQICTAPPPVATRVSPDLPPEIDAFFARALDRDPARRFGSAREMAEAFAALVRRAEANGAGTSGWRRVARVADEAGPEAVVEAPGGTTDGAGAGARTSILGGRSLPGAAAPDDEPSIVGAPGPAPASEAEIDAFVEQAFGMLLAAPSDAAAPGAVRSGPPESTVPNGRAALLRPHRRSPVFRSSLIARLAQIGSIRAAPRARARPGVVARLINQGFASLRRGEREGARRCWREALGLDPSNRMLALNLRRLEAMIATRR
jgi:serine/threonine-protein kinase